MYNGHSFSTYKRRVSGCVASTCNFITIKLITITILCLIHITIIYTHSNNPHPYSPFYPCTIILSNAINLNALPTSSVGVEPHTAGFDALSDTTAPEYMFHSKFCLVYHNKDLSHKAAHITSRSHRHTKYTVASSDIA